MNEYIGTVKDSYMFTNRLSNITVGDILYNYEKIKYHRMAMTPQDKADWYNGYLPKDTPKEEFAKPEEYTFSAFNTSKIYGTGKINAKYRVVEVLPIEYDDNNIPLIYNSRLNAREFVGLYWRAKGWRNHKYIIKLELIEQIEYELSEFYKYSYAMENYKYCVRMKYRKEGFNEYINETKNDDTFRVSQFNGLQKVVYIGDNK